jgi:hypothetical protein
MPIGPELPKPGLVAVGCHAAKRGCSFFSHPGFEEPELPHVLVLFARVTVATLVHLVPFEIQGAGLPATTYGTRIDVQPHTMQ